MNYVLIFCDSTAGRLIYARSHYNMCAGGGYMYQISNEKFGLFVTELRKEKNLTQKDLAEKLYVSDKTVSKWERGLSMPNVVLLIPIADILDVTVTELLRGEKIDTQKNIDTKEVEELVVGSLDMAVRNSIHQHRKNWILAYLLCFLISITEIIMLVVSRNSIAEMKDDILLVTGLMLLFGAWFCFFAKDILPTYYDANKNVIEEYTYDDSVVDGVNVPPRVYRIITDITAHGGTIEKGTKITETSKRTGKSEIIDAGTSVEYGASELDRSVVNKKQIKEVLMA